ncbi:MAG: class I SAM-dependent methyltransferase [Phycisphaerales bacterium]
MLRRGWRVFAHDGHPEGIRRLRERPECAAALADGRLELVLADFADVEIPRASLVNASFSLPFCPPGEFPGLWRKIEAAVAPGARFSGQLFGDRDDWAILEDRTHLTRTQALDLFSDYILESFREEDRPSTHDGEAHKHWHLFHIIARRRDT